MISARWLLQASLLLLPAWSAAVPADRGPLEDLAAPDSPEPRELPTPTEGRRNLDERAVDVDVVCTAEPDDEEGTSLLQLYPRADNLTGTPTTNVSRKHDPYDPDPYKPNPWDPDEPIAFDPRVTIIPEIDCYVEVSHAPRDRI